MSDRICIHSGAKISVEISAEDLLSCCDECGMGQVTKWVQCRILIGYQTTFVVFLYFLCDCRCFGGFPSAAWEFWAKKGLVTGGLYQSKVGTINKTVTSNVLVKLFLKPVLKLRVIVCYRLQTLHYRWMWSSCKWISSPMSGWTGHSQVCGAVHRWILSILSEGQTLWYRHLKSFSSALLLYLSCHTLFDVTVSCASLFR